MSVPAFERRANPNPNASTANVVTISFVPIVDILVLSGGLNPAMAAKLPENVRKG